MSTKKKSEKFFELDKHYVAIPPSKTITGDNGRVQVTTKLYGPVSPERLDLELRANAYRMEQLTPIPKRVERIVESRREPGVYIDRDDVAPERRVR